MKARRSRRDRHAEYLRKCNFAERHAATMLRRLHRAFTVAGMPYSEEHAARIAGNYAGETGLSFHEAIYELVMMAARPWKGRPQVWGR